MGIKVLDIIKKSIRDTIFYPVCPACREVLDFDDADGLCKECCDNTHILAGNVCDECGGLLIEESIIFENGVRKRVCRDCLQSSRNYTKARAIFAYTEPVRKIINRLKSYGDSNSLGTLVNLTKRYLPKDILDFDWVVPVPTTRTKLLKRGFNPTSVLARKIFGESRVLLGCLIRVKDSPDQKILSSKERLENLKGAFLLKRPELISGKKVLLFDDVFTTGATVSACVEALKTANPSQINVFTIAKTVNLRITKGGV